MSIKLVRVKNNGSSDLFELPQGESVIGRSSDCRLRIPVATVSRKHCQLLVDGDKLVITDLGSQNGTIVNNKPITGPYAIRSGDTLQVGPLKFAFQFNGQVAANKTADAQPQAKTPAAKSAAPAPAKPQPAVTKKPEESEDDLAFFDDDVLLSNIPDNKQGSSSSQKSQPPQQKKDEDLDDDLAFLADDDLSFDKDADAMGSSASSLH